MYIRWKKSKVESYMHEKRIFRELLKKKTESKKRRREEGIQKAKERSEQMEVHK